MKRNCLEKFETEEIRLLNNESLSLGECEYGRKTCNGEMIKMLKRREKSDTYLTHNC
jgi:hypothetical protein